jgi:hypothetical protein
MLWARKFPDEKQPLLKFDDLHLNLGARGFVRKHLSILFETFEIGINVQLGRNTLIRTDLLYESVLKLIRTKPWLILKLLGCSPGKNHSGNSC